MNYRTTHSWEKKFVRDHQYAPLPRLLKVGGDLEKWNDRKIDSSRGKLASIVQFYEGGIRPSHQTFWGQDSYSCSGGFIL